MKIILNQHSNQAQVFNDELTRDRSQQCFSVRLCSELYYSVKTLFIYSKLLQLLRLFISL